MTEDDRRLLRENNQMLRQLLSYIHPRDNVTGEEFMANVLANLISNRLDSNYGR